MKRDNKGFSLVELIIVIAIMAILIGALALQYVKYVEKSRKTKDEHMVDSLVRMAVTLTADEEYYTYLDEGDWIRFDSSGITTNSDMIKNTALNDYVSGWEGVKVQSKTYKDKYYEIEFVTYMDEYRLSVAKGWYESND